jgi:ribosome-associated protein
VAKLVARQTSADDDFIPNTRRIAALAEERHAINIRAYDVRGLTTLADSFIMCSARSEPQLKAVISTVKEGMKEIGVAPLRIEGQFTSGWVLIDYGTIVCHVFREESRVFYDLDGMWADAQDIPLDLDEPAEPDPSSTAQA